jgi:hypothetical protein
VSKAAGRSPSTCNSLPLGEGHGDVSSCDLWESLRRKTGDIGGRKPVSTRRVNKRRRMRRLASGGHGRIRQKTRLSSCPA